jgi:hypothetical protein
MVDMVEVYGLTPVQITNVHTSPASPLFLPEIHEQN